MRLLKRALGLPELEPVVARSFRREQITELTLPVATSPLEGGFVAVVAAKAFDVEPWVLAVISASPMFGNLSSLAWNRVAAARPKAPMIAALQALVLVCVLMIALSPRTAFGAGLLVAAVIASRMLIAGIVTVRSVIWSLNYGRTQRARLTGRLQLISSAIVVVTTSAASFALDAHPDSFRWIYAGATLFGAVGVVAFSGVRVVGEKRHLVLERRLLKHEDARGGLLQILKNDKLYARYQLYQFTSGVAAMMLEPPLVFLVSKQMGASYMASIGITLIIPFFLTLTTLPLWARYLDRVHVVEYRAKQNALWLIGIMLMFWGAHQQSLLWLAAGRIVSSIVNAGGGLAWQLGHNDFAPKEQLSAYMGVHVMLTGVRGAFAPFLGMALYVGWPASALLFAFPGLGEWLFIASAILAATAWQGFTRLRGDVRELARTQRVAEKSL
ncbi:MAG: hypothetical protein AB7M12_02640 [Hyphomonadaceae bacterium]